MTVRSDGRRVISLTMQPAIYEMLYEHCRKIDQPITVFVRELIKREINRPSINSMP